MDVNRWVDQDSKMWWRTREYWIKNNNRNIPVTIRKSRRLHTVYYSRVIYQGKGTTNELLTFIEGPLKSIGREQSRKGKTTTKERHILLTKRLFLKKRQSLFSCNRNPYFFCFVKGDLMVNSLQNLSWLKGTRLKFPWTEEGILHWKVNEETVPVVQFYSSR